MRHVTVLQFKLLESYVDTGLSFACSFILLRNTTVVRPNFLRPISTNLLREPDSFQLTKHAAPFHPRQDVVQLKRFFFFVMQQET